MKRYYCTSGETTLGPMSAEQLRGLAQEGAIKTTDLVWLEGSDRRTLAAEVKGLFANPPSPPLGPIPDATLSSSVEPTLSSEITTAPIIRITRHSNILGKPFWCMFHPYHLIALCGNELLDARFVRRPRLGEDDCSHAGVASFLERRGAFSRRLPLADVTWMKCDCRTYRSFLGKRMPRERVMIRIRTKAGRRTLRLHRRDATNLLARLETVSGSTPIVRWIRYPGLVVTVIVTVLFALIHLILTAVLADVFGFDDVESGLGLLWLLASSSIAVVLVFLAVLLRRLLARDETAKVPSDALRALVWRTSKGGDQSGRAPFRSKPLGIMIKLVAAGWVIVMLLLHRALIPRSQIAATEFEDSTAGAIAEWHASSQLSFWAAMLTLPAVAMLYWGHALVAKGNPLDAGDTRRPFLYLRSFDLDGRSSLQPRGWLAAFLGISGAGSFRAWWREIFEQEEGFLFFSSSFRLTQCVHPLRLLRLFLGITADTTEHSLVKHFGKMGPVVAIGKPGERIAETGAYREYVKTDEWQRAVMQAIDHCQAVLVQPAQSGGMQWELRHVCKQVPLEKILIILPRTPGVANDYETLVAFLSPLTGVRFPRLPAYCERPAVLWFGRDASVQWTELSYRSPTTWILSGNAADLEYTLRPFLQGIHGGDREKPRPVRRYGWLHVAAAWALVGAWTMSAGLLLTLGTDRPVLTEPIGRTIRGTRPSYAIDLPISWIEETPREPNITRFFYKPGVGDVRIVESAEDDGYSEFTLRDLSDLVAAITEQLESNVDVRVAMVESKQLLERDGRHGTDIVWRLTWSSGDSQTRRLVAFSGSSGTVAVVVDILDGVQDEQRNEIAAIVSSLRFP